MGLTSLNQGERKKTLIELPSKDEKTPGARILTFNDQISTTNNVKRQKNLASLNTYIKNLKVSNPQFSSFELAKSDESSNI